MNVFATMLARVLATAEALTADGALPAGLDRTRVTVEPPRDPAGETFGDMTTNATLVLAKEAGRTPRELAEAIAERLRAESLIEHAEVAGPGFINITLRPEAWRQALRASLVGSEGFGALPALGMTENSKKEESSDTKCFDDLSHLTSEADRDAVRFMRLYRPPGSAPEINLSSAREQSYGNPVFCVQYGHARARSVFRQARDTFPDLPAGPAECAALWREAPLELLADPHELALIRRIAQYPHIVETAAIIGEPHRLAIYLHDLASAFHTHSRHGIATPHLRFIIQNDRRLTVARLALVEAVVIILAAGLSRLGVGAPDEIT